MLGRMFSNSVAEKFSWWHKELYKEDGTLTQDPEEMRLVATNFYQKLLSSEGCSKDIELKRQEVWASIKPTVTFAMRTNLSKPFTSLEIEEALQALPKKSCPGEDCLSPEFYKNNWGLCKDTLCTAFQEIMDT